MRGDGLLDSVDVTCWPAGPCVQAEMKLTAKSAVQCKVWRMPAVTLFSSPHLLTFLLSVIMAQLVLVSSPVRTVTECMSESHSRR